MGQPEGDAPAAPTAPAWPANAAQAIYLARRMMMALQQAVETGNFTVLRDMGSPGFRAQNTATDLAISFQALRQSGADLTAVAVVAPQLSTPPFLDPQKQRTLSACFPRSRWRSISTCPSKTSTTASASPPSA